MIAIYAKCQANYKTKIRDEKLAYLDLKYGGGGGKTTMKGSVTFFLNAYFK